MHDGMAGEFDHLMAHAVPVGGRLGHREHVKLTWLAVRHYGASRARTLIEDGLLKTARYAGVPQKYNVTMTRAWVDAVAFHLRDRSVEESFDQFADAHPGLLDKRFLMHFYRSTTLADPRARTGWVAPDLRPFPWA